MVLHRCNVRPKLGNPGIHGDRENSKCEVIQVGECPATPAYIQNAGLPMTMTKTKVGPMPVKRQYF